MKGHAMRRWITARLAFYNCKDCGNHHLTRIGCWLYGSTAVRHR